MKYRIFSHCYDILIFISFLLINLANFVHYCCFQPLSAPHSFSIWDKVKTPCTLPHALYKRMCSSSFIFLKFKFNYFISLCMVIYFLVISVKKLQRWNIHPIMFWYYRPNKSFPMINPRRRREDQLWLYRARIHSLVTLRQWLFQVNCPKGCLGFAWQERKILL